MSAEPLNTPIPNLPLLRKVLDHIDAHPEEWNQAAWMTETTCGTACCIAGHAIVFDGTHTLTVANDDVLVDGVSMVRGEDGRWHDAAAIVGAKVLGLTEDEAGDLFHGWNGRADVQHFAERIAARAGERL